jgi:hypothetical protein
MHLLEEDLRFNTYEVYQGGKVSMKSKDQHDLIQECISLKEAEYYVHKDAVSDLFEIVYRNDHKRIISAKVLVKATHKSSLAISKIFNKQNTFKINKINSRRTFVALADENIVQNIIDKHVRLRNQL